MDIHYFVHSIGGDIMKDHDKIFETEVKVTYQEYKKIQLYFPYSFWKKYIITITIIFCISLFALVSTEPVTISELLLTNLLFMVIVFLLFKGISLFVRKLIYKKKLNKNIDNIHYKLIFYRDYFKKKSESLTQKIEYSNIWKIKEIDNHIYILLDRKNIIPILKENCSNEFIEFLKESKTLCSKGSSKIENLNEYIEPSKKYSKMRFFLIILFILTILSIWLGTFITIFLTSINYPGFLIEYFPSIKVNIFNFYIEVSSALMISYLWGFLLILPIPILSIVLGIIYRKKGLKCLKNIVAGCIVGIVSLIIGFVPAITGIRIEHSYEEAYSYQEFIGVDIPIEGRFFELEIANSDVLFMNYFLWEDTLETRTFYQNIKTHESWISDLEISDHLAAFIPFVCKSTQEECYYSVYIPEMDVYNEIPNEVGEYHIYSMMYDPDLLSLKMMEYIYQKTN